MKDEVSLREAMSDKQLSPGQLEELDRLRRWWHSVQMSPASSTTTEEPNDG